MFHGVIQKITLAQFFFWDTVYNTLKRLHFCGPLHVDEWIADYCRLEKRSSMIDRNSRREIIAETVHPAVVIAARNRCWRRVTGAPGSRMRGEMQQCGGSKPSLTDGWNIGLSWRIGVAQEIADEHRRLVGVSVAPAVPRCVAPKPCNPPPPPLLLLLLLSAACNALLVRRMMDYSRSWQNAKRLEMFARHASSRRISVQRISLVETSFRERQVLDWFHGYPDCFTAFSLFQFFF